MKCNMLLIVAAMLSMPVRIAAQSDGAQYVEPGQDIPASEAASPDHHADDAFLRRYADQDDVDLLLKAAGSRIRRNLVFDAELFGNVGSGDFAPFWFSTNRQGLSSINNKAIALDLGVFGSMYLPSHFHFNYGMEVAVAANHQSDFYLQQIYVDAGYKWFDLSLGAKEHWGELVNSDLSTGGLTWSGNSRPIPQIRLEVPEFTRLGILGRLVSLKGHFAYGWYQDGEWRRDRANIYSKPPQYTDKILHHSKSFFIKVGDPERFPLEVTAGLEMYAQFGGTRHNIPLDVSEPLIADRDLPSDFNAFLRIILPVNKAGEQTKENGNTFGSWHLAFDLTFEKWKYRLYYEHFYEDHSSMLGVEYKPDLYGNNGYVCYGFRRNWADGLFGLEVNAPEGLPFRNIVFEFLNTRGQCGPICKLPPSPILEGVDGRDEMYEHTVYSSYTHYGYANGSPILISPAYNKDGNLKYRSTRAMMFHLGINGNIARHFDYRLMVTHSSQWGTYKYPLPLREEITSLLLEGFYRFSDADSWKIGLSLGADFDNGDLLGDNRGIMLSISKTWKML